MIFSTAVVPRWWGLLLCSPPVNQTCFRLQEGVEASARGKCQLK